MAKKEVLIGDDEGIDVEAAPPPSDADLKKVAELARTQFKLVKEIVELQDTLAEKQSQLKINMEVDLPTAMTELGLTTFGLVGGFSIGIKEIVNGSINDERRPAAHAWLEEHGHGGLIKRKFEILFGREDIAWAKKFMRDLAQRKRSLDVKQKEWVEPQTLGAFVREQLRAAATTGGDPEEYAPSNLLGVFRQRIAVVDGPDMPKPGRKGKK